jgi:hypothetical protein
MPFASTCVDVVGTCGNAIPRVEIGQGVTDTLRIPLVDPNPVTGGPVDLTQYGFYSSSSPSSESSQSSDWSSSSSSSGEPKHGVEFVAKEMPYDSSPFFCVMGTVASEEDARDGIVELDFTTAMTARPGIWLGMALIWEHGLLKKHLPFYLDVLPNLGMINTTGGPLTFYEVRLSVRDVCPEANILLDAMDFQPHEIAAAIRWPIDYWNETPPPTRRFTPMNFPYRYHWRLATVGELMIMVGTWLQRNNLDYSIAGLTVKDSARWPEYMKMGEVKKQEYKEWTKEEKIALNIASGYRSLGGWRYPMYR